MTPEKFEDAKKTLDFYEQNGALDVDTGVLLTFILKKEPEFREYVAERLKHHEDLYNPQRLVGLLQAANSYRGGE